MKLLRRFILASVLITVTAYSGCTTGSDEYTVHVPQGHTVYKIWRPGVIITDDNFDVALIYGFSDNRFVAQEIVDSLNQKEPNTYFLSEVD